MISANIAAILVAILCVWIALSVENRRRRKGLPLEQRVTTPVDDLISSIIYVLLMVSLWKYIFFN